MATVSDSASKPIKIKNVTALVSEWQIVSDDKFHEMLPYSLLYTFLPTSAFLNNLISIKMQFLTF